MRRVPPALYARQSYWGDPLTDQAVAMPEVVLLVFLVWMGIVELLPADTSGIPTDRAKIRYCCV